MSANHIQGLAAAQWCDMKSRKFGFPDAGIALLYLRRRSAVSAISLT
jgi:hypothetical protein